MRVAREKRTLVHQQHLQFLWTDSTLEFAMDSRHSHLELQLTSHKRVPEFVRRTSMYE